MQASNQVRGGATIYWTIATIFMALAFIFVQPGSAQGQWATNGNNITNTNPGNVGIGTINPQASLHVSTPSTNVAARGIIDEQTSNDGNAALMILRKSRAGGAVINGDFIGNVYADAFDGSGFVSGGRMRFGVDGPVTAGNVPTAIQFLTGSNSTGVERMRVTSSGNVGISTMTPGSKLHVAAGGLNVGPLAIGTLDGTIEASGSTAELGFARRTLTTLPATLAAGDRFVWYNPNGSARLYTDTAGDLMTMTSAGNLGLGTATPTSRLHVVGDVTVTGNISAKYQDVAEWVPANKMMPAGTVVVLDKSQSNQVKASFKAYDTRVAGVVSAQPGIALGESGANKVLVATTGRVKVKVDARDSAIEVGDLLVTSDIEGVATKSEPMMINGREFHSPGTLIGKALEPLEKGKTGEILVLLSLQ